MIKQDPKGPCYELSMGNVPGWMMKEKVRVTGKGKVRVMGKGKGLENDRGRRKRKMHFFNLCNQQAIEKLSKSYFQFYTSFSFASVFLRE